MTCVVNLHHKVPYDVYIGRGSKWGNKFEIGKDGTRDQVIAKYRAWIIEQTDLLDSLHELSGKTLGCFCFPSNCHGFVLVELIESGYYCRVKTVNNHSKLVNLKGLPIAY